MYLFVSLLKYSILFAMTYKSIKKYSISFAIWPINPLTCRVNLYKLTLVLMYNVLTHCCIDFNIRFT